MFRTLDVLLSFVVINPVFAEKKIALTLWTDLNETVLPSADILFSSGRRVFDTVTVNRINMNENFSSLMIFDTNAENNFTVLMISCSVSIDRHLPVADIACICYETPQFQQYYHCKHTIERRQEDIIVAVTNQSAWRDAILFTDNTRNSLSTGLVDQEKCFSLACDTSSFDMTRVLHAYNTQDDYYNIVINCDDEITVNIMKQIKQTKATSNETLKRSNYLLTTAATFTHISNLSYLLIDGDNAGVIWHEREVYSGVKLTEVFASERLVWPQPAFRIERCISDCHKRPSYMFVGVYHRPEEILEREDRVVSAVFQQFYGRKIIVAAGDYPPYYIESMEDNTHGGMGYEIVTALAEYFNYSAEFVPPVDHKWGSIGANGKWNGMVGMVLYGVADFCIGGITISQQRLSAIDFTTPHHEETNALLLNLPWKRWGFFYEVFNKNVWLALILLPLIPTVTLWLFKQLFAYLSFDDHKDPLTDVLFQCYSIVMLQGVSFPIKHFSGRLVLFCFWLTVIITMATYTGNLTASLAVRKVNMPFTTLREIAERDDYILTIKAGSIREALFQNSRKDSVYGMLWQKIQRTPSKSYVKGSADAIARMKKDPSILYTADKTAIRNRMILTGSCSFVLLPEEYFPSGFGIGMRKGSPQIRHFNQIIRRIMEMGLTKFWEKKYEIKDLCGDLTQASASGVAIGVEDSFWLFVILAAGTGVSLVVLTMECFVMAIKRSRCTKDNHLPCKR